MERLDKDFSEHGRRLIIVLFALSMLGAVFVVLPSEVEALPPSKVAYFRDFNPWGLTSTDSAMSAYGIEYDIYTQADMATVNLAMYDKVITASAQDYTFYEELANNRAKFESFVAAGGCLEFHGATFSSDDWDGLVMPGGFSGEMNLIDDVTIINTTHDIMLVPNFINDFELDGWLYSSHGILKDFSQPYEVLISDALSGEPVAIEIRYMAGSIIATMQTLEWAWYFGYSPILENYIYYMPPKQPHDIAVVDVAVPDVNERTVPVLVNVTVKNTGANTEIDIPVNFYVNGAPAGNAMILSLGMGNFTVLSFPWTPIVDGNYNLTASVPPLVGENVTINNQLSRFVTVVDTTAPAMPTGLSVDLVPTGSALNVSWNANTEPDLTFYNVYRSMDAITYTRATQIPAGTEYYVDTGLGNGLTYFYRISAEDYVPNESPWTPAVANAPDFDSDGDGIGDMNDFDDDNDGVPDIIDRFPLDPNEYSDVDGDGIGDNADTDNDNDGVEDINDDFPRNPNEWLDTDGDGVGDNSDTDDDDDGFTDDLERQLGSDPKDPMSTPVDTDGDGVPDILDDDDDNDGYSDVVEEIAGSDPTDPNSVPDDTDGDGVIDIYDEDDDNDGYPDDMEEQAGSNPKVGTSTPPDSDGDGIIDQFDEDDDNDGYSDVVEEQAGSDPKDAGDKPVDTDGDGIIDLYDQDDDNDGVYDERDAFPKNSAEWMDTDGDGIGDNFDDDRDGDGVNNNDDDFPRNPFEYIDTDGDGVGDNADIDSDGNGVADYLEPVPEDPPEPPPDWSPPLLIVVIILMIIILIAMLMVSRSKPKGEETPPPPEE